MKCRSCKGRGDWGKYDFPPDSPEYDPEDAGVSLCDFCDGMGRMSIAQFAGWLRLHAGIRYRRWSATTRAGRCWWMVWRYVRVRRLKRAFSREEIAAKLAARKYRLAMFQAYSEMFSIDQVIETEKRLVWEAEAAGGGA